VQEIFKGFCVVYVATVASGVVSGLVSATVRAFAPVMETSAAAAAAVVEDDIITSGTV
jgi:hypothetical protein